MASSREPRVIGPGRGLYRPGIASFNPPSRPGAPDGLDCAPMHPLLPDLGRSGRRTAVWLGETAVGYAELERLALGHAARLRSEGISPGERVAVWATPELPTVAAVAGNALMGDREKCLAAGMDDYVSKPFGMDRLRSVLERWIAEKQNIRS